MEVHVAFQNNFYEGEFIGRKCLGVFSTPEKANQRFYEEEADTDSLFDPMFRVSYEVVTTELDQGLFEDIE